MTGKVGADVSLEKAQEAAKIIAINILATLKGRKSMGLVIEHRR
jgi:hypothetical protein